MNFLIIVTILQLFGTDLRSKVWNGFYIQTIYSIFIDRLKLKAMTGKTKKLTVTAIQDEDEGVVTAFFNELPGLVVQGKNRDDVSEKLVSLLDSYIERLENSDRDFDIKMQTIS